MTCGLGVSGAGPEVGVGPGGCWRHRDRLPVPADLVARPGGHRNAGAGGELQQEHFTVVRSREATTAERSYRSPGCGKALLL